MVSTLQKVSDVLTKIMRGVMVVLFIWMVVSLESVLKPSK